MNSSILAGLEQADPELGNIPGTGAAAFALLWQEWLEQCAADQGVSDALQTYVLLDGWSEDDAWCAVFARQWPKEAQARCRVSAMSGSQPEERSLFLLPLPLSLSRSVYSHSLREALDRECFYDLLDSAWRTVLRRVSKQRFCGLLRTRAALPKLVSHLAALMEQRPLSEMQPVWFRFHDPRVHQRVWESLNTEQQHMWLGVVQQWWQLVQPWKGWTREQVTDASSFKGTPLLAGKPAWRCFTTNSNQPVAAFAAGRCMQASDLQAANVVPVANRIWRRFMTQAVPLAGQPDGQAMHTWLSECAALGLTDRQSEDYVWWSYRLGRDGQPVDWTHSRWSRVKQAVLERLRLSEEASFSRILDQVIQGKAS